MALRVNTQVALFTREIRADENLSAPRLIEPQLLDRRIEMGSGNVRTDAVEHGQLLFKRSQYSLRASIARRGR